MVQAAGYLVDLSSIALDESSGVPMSWIQAMPHGTYHHPVYGKIVLNEERSRRFAANVVNQVRGQDLDIDYDHKEREGAAAGWVKTAEARPDGLYLQVEWTKRAATAIKAKEYRYFSPEFVDEWEHPVSKQKYQDVLFGGGITNRPFLKGILPVNLSEAFHVSDSPTGGQMDLKKLCELLGLPEDSTEEQVMTKLAELVSTGGSENKSQQQQTPATTLSEEAKEELKKLAESNPAIKELAEGLEKANRTLAEQAAALRLSEVTIQVKTLNETAKSKNLAFPVPVVTELQELLLKAPKELSDKFVGMLTKLAETGMVELDERGGNKPGSEDDPVKKFGEAVSAIMEKEKMSYSDAVLVAADRNPELFNEYRGASTSFKV